MAKEGKNNFELKKGKRYQFDLSKNPKRTFDLVKDTDDASMAVGPLHNPVDSKPTETQPVNNPKAPGAPVTSTASKGNAQPCIMKDLGNTGNPTVTQSDNQNNTTKMTKGNYIPKHPVTPAVSTTTNETGNGRDGNNKWMWVIGAILVLAIIVWLCSRGCSSSNDNDATTEPTVEAIETTGTSEEEAVVEESTIDGEGEEPASSDAETENPTTEVGSSAEAMSSIATPLETQTSATTATMASTPSTVISETVSRPAANTVSTAASATAPELTNDIEAEALKVIRGDYGTGIERKLKLGSKYREIQNRVNELKRRGAF